VERFSEDSRYLGIPLFGRLVPNLFRRAGGWILYGARLGIQLIPLAAATFGAKLAAENSCIEGVDRATSTTLDQNLSGALHFFVGHFSAGSAAG
jgi:hypothetical protein